MVTHDTKIKKAIKLRKAGFSYSEISKKLRISKRDLLIYCKKIKFSNKGLKRYLSKVKGIKKHIKKQSNKLTKNKVRIMGHLFFDGSLFNTERYHYVLSYVNSSLELVKQFINDIKIVYGIIPSAFEKTKGINVNYYRVKFYSKEAYDDLIKYSHSYSTSNKTIKIPKEIMDSNINLKIEFIRSFWEDEGSVSLIGKKVNADLKNYHMIHQLGEIHKQLRINFNIINYKQRGNIFYKLYLMNNKNNLNKFYNNHLFILSRVSKGNYIGYKKLYVLKELIKKYE